jgi:hypothetical protein
MTRILGHPVFTAPTGTRATPSRGTDGPELARAERPDCCGFPDGTLLRIRPVPHRSRPESKTILTERPWPIAAGTGRVWSLAREGAG